MVWGMWSFFFEEEDGIRGYDVTGVQTGALPIWEGGALWDSSVLLAREAGVSDAVIDGIAAGTGPRGLLPKEGIWVHFAQEVLRDKMRDSTWQATTHLVGHEGAVALAFTACYYDMMARLNRTFGLDTA